MILPLFVMCILMARAEAFGLPWHRTSLRAMQSTHEEKTTPSSNYDLSKAPTPSPPLTKIPSHLISTLDLIPLMAHVASTACTKRGKEAIVDLVSQPSPNGSIFDKSRGGKRKSSLFVHTNRNNQRERRQDWFDKSRQGLKYSKLSFAPIAVAQTSEEAISEYQLVHEAMEILKSQQSLHDTIPLPPMFELNDGESTTDTDDDEWIDLCIGPLPPGVDLYQEIDLETVLRAEQVVKLLLETHEWAMSERIKESSPGLVDIVQKIECHEEEGDDTQQFIAGKGNVAPLSDLYVTLRGAVEIVRAGPNLSDVNNRFSYQFRLATGNGRFPELDLLREKEQRLLDQKEDNSQKLAIIREEIAIEENKITRTLIASMISAAQDAERGMSALARLDVIFARASFGCDWDGVVPEIGNEGRVHVEKFVHPVLALERETVNGSGGSAIGVVPVDLVLPGRGGYQSLIISGPNGGGKTLALKSFGLVAMMVKLGLPITTTTSKRDGPSIVDFFEDVVVEVGDTQSITKHESTLMARLNALASLIENMSASNPNSDVSASSLVLLDELGGGTDPAAGSALAQSILEKLIAISPMCKIIATTHSPQLKALSINDDRFECASVLLSNEKDPNFKLSYGITGESFALEAARRCHPPLPDDVIDRATELMDGGDGESADSLRTYLLELEQQQQNIREVAMETEKTWREVCECRDDMLSKIQVSRMQFSRLESRLESVFDTLKSDEGRSAYELVGDSLDELRLLKRRVQTEEELLSDKGLRRVPDSYSFYEGENVVIIAEGEWKGYDAIVKTSDDLKVTVVPVLDLFSINEDDAQQPLILFRRNVAVFDYPEWGFTDETAGGTDSYSNQKESTSKVLSALSTLNADNSKGTTQKSKAREDTTTFTSARERKAVAAAEKAASKQKKGNKGKKRK